MTSAGAEFVYRARVDTVSRYYAMLGPPQITANVLCGLSGELNKSDGIWTIVNYQTSQPRVGTQTMFETFVVLRVSDKTLWAVTIERQFDDDCYSDVLHELTPVRMVNCLAVAYVEASGSGEQMAVLALKAPQVIRDATVQAANPADAMRRLFDAASKPGAYIGMNANLLTITRASTYLLTRCLELQGPAENPPVVS